MERSNETTRLLPLVVAADEMCVSRHLLFRAVRRGQVPATKIGRQWFVDLGALAERAEAEAAERRASREPR